MAKDIRQSVSYVPVDSGLLDLSGLAPQLDRYKQFNRINESYRRFLSDVHTNVNALSQYQFEALTVNPDFNWCRTKGTTPTTQADGDDAEFIEQWFVWGATDNAYTITPTAYADDASNNPTGSKYYPNFEITQLDDDFYIYNVNSNSDFNFAQKLQGQSLAISTWIDNVGDTTPTLQFRLEIEGIAEALQGHDIVLEPGLNKLWDKILVPEFEGTSIAANAYARLQLWVTDLGGVDANFNIKYIKNEIGSLATNPTVNHILQKVIIDNL